MMRSRNAVRSIHIIRTSKREIDKIITTALMEDVGSGDVTTNSIVAIDEHASAHFYAKQNGVVSGLEIAKFVFKKLDRNVVWENHVNDGDRVAPGMIIASVKGPCHVLLTGERTALNFLQRMSGISTATAGFVQKVKGTTAQVLDTRKTVPGLRLLDKYSVRIGGGMNHRFGLYDMALIKNNHIKFAGSLSSAIQILREKNSGKIIIEVETTNLSEVREALKLKADIIMLDNMTVNMMKKAVRIIQGQAKIEASGNITMRNIRAVAETGVDYISVGALTHSVSALDINMKVMK